MLFGVTLFVDLVAMATTLWGAFYLFARGFPSWITLRTVIVLLLLSIFFFGAYNNLFHQVVGSAALRAVLLILGLTTWYSLTFKLMSARARIRLRRVESLIYIVGGVTATLILATQPFVDEVGNGLFVARMEIGLASILYAVFQLIIAVGILYNLLTDTQVGLTRQGKYFLVASSFPAAAIVVGLIGLSMTPQLPRVIPDILIFSGVLLLGMSVARHQTLVERRTTIQDLPVSALTVLGLAAIYMLLALRWGLPLESTGAVVAFAILTHCFYDLAREMLERQRIRHESTFRRQLRQLENQVADEEILRSRLQTALDLLCNALLATGGFIAIRQGESFIVAASNHAYSVDSQLPSALVACDDIVQRSSDQLPGIDWLAPAFDEQTQIAVIGLRRPEAKLTYSTGDLDLLAEVADQVGTLISLSNLATGRTDQIQQWVAESEEKATEFSTVANQIMTNITNSPDGALVKIVEDSLRHFSDYIFLGQSALADWMGIEAESHIERGKQVQSFLASGIESLRPAGARPPEPLPRVWYNYAVLHDAYIQGVPNREIMARLYISEGTFNRTRRNALRGLARLLIEKRKRGSQAAPS